jgi:molybdopterin-guanine dinucleotide biosynthesis protein A
MGSDRACRDPPQRVFGRHDFGGPTPPSWRAIEARQDLRHGPGYRRGPGSTATVHEETSSGTAALITFTNRRRPRRPPRPLPVVVLAGGRSVRFGRDKLVARVDDIPSLARVVARVAPLASCVSVAVATESSRRRLARLLPPTVSFLTDRPDRWGSGPAGAMARGRARTASGPMLFLPGDLPWVETAALRRFIARADATDADVAVPYWPDGGTENLIQWHRDRSTLQYLPRFRPVLGRGMRASEFLRAVPRTLLVPLATLTRRPGSFAHLTVPSDLEHAARRGTWGPLARERIVQGWPKRWHADGLRFGSSGRWWAATGAFASEWRWYARHGLSGLARHSLADAVRAATRTSSEPQRLGTVNRAGA